MYVRFARIAVTGVLVVAASALFTGVASADTPHYVDNTNPACNDSGDGSQATPYCTIGRGTTGMLGGQTLYVGNGTYNEQVSPPSGTSGSPVTVTNTPGATPIVSPTTQTHGVYLANKSYVVVSGLTVSNTTAEGVYVTGGDHITLSGLRVTLSGRGDSNTYGFQKGIKVVGATASTIQGSTVDHNTDSGIYLAQGATGNLVTGNTAYANARGGTNRAAAGIDLRSPNSVIGNVTHDNEDTGIQLYTGSDGSLVANNITYRNGDHGIDDFQAPNQRIVSNSVYRNVTAGINVEGGSTGALVANNISVDNGIGSPRSVGDIRVDSSATTGTSVHHNLVYLHAPGAYYVWGITNYPTLASFVAAQPTQEAGGVQADPWWANPDAGNVALTAGSPAIDSADSTVSGEQTTDQLGVARYDDPAVTNGPTGYYDRGALEAPAGTTDASPRPALSVSPGSGTAPVSITANASASTDTDATGIAGYSFDFGDGTSSGPQTSASASHSYGTPGTYILAVSVSDTAGLTSTAATQVFIGAAGNLVANSTFETNLTGWATDANCPLNRVAAGHNGGWAADLSNTGTGSTTCTLNDSPNWVLHSVAGSYHATAWVLTSVTGGSLKMRLREYNGSLLVGSVIVTGVQSSDWQQLSATLPITSPGSTVDLTIYQTGQPAGSELFVDDVTEQT